MQTYEVVVSERSIRANSKDMTLVRTSVGVDQLHVLFDDREWMEFPITATFAQGDDVVTVPLIVTEIGNSDEWCLEATCNIPWEVIDQNGPIRLTFQGTDENGRHIITAYGSPLSVEEAGDVSQGIDPSGTVTPSEIEQLFARAMEAVNEAASLVDNLGSRLDEMVASAAESVEHYELPVATADTLGGIKPDGTTITVDADGTAHGTDSYELPVATTSTIGGVKPDGRSISVAEDGTISASLEGSIPIATIDTLGGIIPDGTTVTVDDDGMAHASAYIQKATSSSLGVVRPDNSTITINASGVITASVGGTYELTPATTDTIGGVKPDGTTITVDNDGTIHGATTYSLPVATTSTLGGVKPDGETITADADGTIHGTAEVSAATTETLGAVMPDGETITVDLDGTIHAAGGQGPYKFDYVGNSRYDHIALIAGDDSDGIYEFPNITWMSASVYTGVSWIKEARFPSCTRVNICAFSNCSNLASVSMPVCTTVAGSAFASCRSLSGIDLPECTSIDTRAFYSCQTLAYANIPKCSTVGSYAFCYCPSLSSVRLGECGYIGTCAFMGCVMLTTLDIRDVTSVPAIAYDALGSTPIGGYSEVAGQYGSIVVPASLYSSFTRRWSTYASRFVSV